LETRKRPLVAKPVGVVTVMPPLVAPVGTIVVIRVSLTTVCAASTDPNLTDVVPVNPDPVIVTVVPTGPDVGEIDVIVGPAVAVVTVKAPELVPVPAEFVTAIAPVVAPAGTVAVSCESELIVNVADVPLNFTPVAAVNPVPFTVTDVPTGPLVGVKPLIVGAATVDDEQPGSWNDPIRVSQSSPARVVGCAS
jgi:hypothetical protein